MRQFQAGAYLVWRFLFTWRELTLGYVKVLLLLPLLLVVVGLNCSASKKILILLIIIIIILVENIGSLLFLSMSCFMACMEHSCTPQAGARGCERLAYRCLHAGNSLTAHLTGLSSRSCLIFHPYFMESLADMTRPGIISGIVSR